MRIGPLTITRTKAAGGSLVTAWPVSAGGATGGWWPVLRESFTGAWQRGIVAKVDDALTHPIFWACVTLIAGDVAKTRPMLMTTDDDGIASETSCAAYSPVIAKPNHYQNRIQFYAYWAICLLTRGNAYVLKERDQRGVVVGMYLLDATHARPLVTPGGDVYYALGQDVLAGVTEQSVIVPAREIIHDRINTLYHPLVGLSPVYAAGHAAMQALQIMSNSTRLFSRGSLVGGVVTAPGQISEATAKRLEEYWDANYNAANPENIGRVAVLGDGLKFEKPQVMSAVDAQLIDQLKWDDEKICSTFHVPPYMVGVGPLPSYNNVESLSQQYYSQCLQLFFEGIELCLAEGLELKKPYDVEFDLDCLFRMDSVQKMEAATKGVTGGIYTPNEARKRFNLKPKPGGDQVFLQKQNWPLDKLGSDDTPPAPPKPAEPPPPPPAPAAKKELLDDIDAGDLLRDVTKAMAA